MGDRPREPTGRASATALQNFVGPPQNIVYADIDGTIGFIAPGRIPIRRNGDGWLPVPGWTGEYDWTGFIPFDALPQAVNPASGHFVSANNKIVPDELSLFHQPRLGSARPRRAHRGAARREPRAVAATSSAAIQADTLSLMAQQLVPLMTGIVPRPTSGPRGRRAAAALGFPHGPRQGRAAAVHRLAARLQPLDPVRPARRCRRRLLGFAAAGHGGGADPAAGMVRRPEAARRGELCERASSTALDAALAELRRGYGDEMAQWRWGRAHVASFPNAVFSGCRCCATGSRRRSRPGRLRHGQSRPERRSATTRSPFEQRFGAGLRIITDLAAPDESRMIIAPGQSGNPLSPHYADLLQRWRDFDWLMPGRAAAGRHPDLGAAAP